MHNRQGLTLKLLWASLTDYDLWPMYAVSFTLLIPTNPVSLYLTLKLKGLGFDTFETNLLTVPAWVLFLIQLVFWSWVSEKINNRMAIAWVYCAWCFAGLMALELMPAESSPWAWYAVTVLLIGFPYIHSIMGKLIAHSITTAPKPLANPATVSLTSRNAGSVRTRTLGSAMYNMICQASSVIATNVCLTPTIPK